MTAAGVLGIALLCILAGMAMAGFSHVLRFSLLISIVFWAGVVLAVVGIVLLITPALVWLNVQLRQMLGA